MIPKRLKRALSADEQLSRYFHRRQRELDLYVLRQLRVLQVIQDLDAHTSRVLQIQTIHRTLDGFVVRVR